MNEEQEEKFITVECVFKGRIIYLDSENPEFFEGVFVGEFKKNFSTGETFLTSFGNVSLMENEPVIIIDQVKDERRTGRSDGFICDSYKSVKNQVLNKIFSIHSGEEMDITGEELYDLTQLHK